MPNALLENFVKTKASLQHETLPAPPAEEPYSTHPPTPISRLANTQ